MNRRDFLGYGAAFAMASQELQAQPLREISVSLAEHLSVSPFYLADELGYFRQAGIQVKTVRLGAMQALPVLAGGQLDVMFGGLSGGVFNAVSRGLTLKLVAGRDMVQRDCGESYTVYAHKAAFGGGPMDPRKLRGKRFAVRLRGITEYFLDVFLKQHGMQHNDVEKIDLPLNEAIAALAENRIDAFLDMELAQSPVVASANIVKIWNLSDVLAGHQFSFAYFGESMMKSDPLVGTRFLAAYLAGAQEFQKGKTPNFMRYFATRHKLDLQKTISACRNTFPVDGNIDMPSIQRTMDWATARKYAQQSVDTSQLVDRRYLNDAHKMLKNGSWRLESGSRKQG